MPFMKIRAQTPPEKLWLIFDCTPLSLIELKDAYDLLKNSPSICDIDVEQIRVVFRAKKSELKKKYIPHPPPRKTPEPRNTPQKTQPIVVPVKRYVKTPRYKFSMFPEINIPEILQVFGRGKTEPVSPPDPKIPFIKKPVKHN
jgi:hypothetical protein